MTRDRAWSDAAARRAELARARTKIMFSAIGKDAKNEHKTTQLSLVKTCSETEPTCVVTTSTLEVLLGSTINYFDIENLEKPAGSPMLITVAGEHEGTVNGVCHFDSAAKAGHCEFAGGTGSLAGFHANLAGVALGGNDYSLEGPYWFAEATERTPV